MVQLSDDEQYRSYQDVKVGDRVTVSKYKGAGVVRFVGVIDTQHTHGKARVGVELDSACGKHNGTVDGHAYFKCAEKHGLLVPLERVTLLAHGEVGASSPPDDFGSGSSEPSENPAAVSVGPAPGDDSLTGLSSQMRPTTTRTGTSP